MNEQQQRELAERIADDERIATVARKAYDYDALAARLEVLESAFDNSHQLNEQLGDENRALLARVAELEAAQGWRPVTITEPPVSVMAELIIVGYRGDDGYWHYPDGPEGLVIRGWRPGPPSVALQEPTP